MKIKYWIFLSSLFICLPTSAKTIGPEEITLKYYSYLQNDQWGKLADLYHDEALLEFKSSLFSILELEEKQGKNSLRKKIFNKDTTIEQARKASDKEFFTGFVRAFMSKMKKSGLQYSNPNIIGKITENENHVHVLARLKFKLFDKELDQMAVTSAKISNGQWKLTLNEKMKIMIYTIKVMLTQQIHRSK